MMPKSAKGGGRNRSQKKIERYSVPITVQLAAKLKAAAKGRADDAPLLLQSDGSALGQQSRARAIIAKSTRSSPPSVSIPPTVTMYALRHSSIVRMLLRNVPIRLVASLHNTSVAMIEKHYSRYITEHSIDDITRAGLLSESMPATDNVVALVR